MMKIQLKCGTQLFHMKLVFGKNSSNDDQSEGNKNIDTEKKRNSGFIQLLVVRDCWNQIDMFLSLLLSLLVSTFSLAHSHDQ